MKQLSAVREEVEGWQILRQRIHDALDLSQLEDESLRADLEAEVYHAPSRAGPATDRGRSAGVVEGASD